MLQNTNRIDISPVMLEDEGSSSSRTRQSVEEKKSLFENRGYITTIVVLGLFYFFDVFIGMFMLYREYSNEGAYQYEQNESNYKFTDRPYDIIELILLGLILIDAIVKTIFSTRSDSHSKVRMLFILQIVIYSFFLMQGFNNFI